MTLKGYIIKEVNKDNYYCGCKMGHKFSGFYGAKIYKSHKLALKALDKVKSYGKFSIYEVEVTIKIENDDVKVVIDNVE